MVAETWIDRGGDESMHNKHKKQRSEDGMAFPFFFFSFLAFEG